MLKFRVFVLLAFMAQLVTSVQATNVSFSDHTFDGWIAEFPVSATNMQSIINKINAESGDNDVKFTLPPLHLMPDKRYVISIAYGKVTYPSLEAVITPELREVFGTAHDVLHFSFPFLNSEQDKNVRLKFMYMTFTGTEGPYIEPNVVMPHLHADKLLCERFDDGTVALSFVYGDLALNMSGKISSTCHEPPEKTIEVLDEFVQELTISHIQADLCVCEDLSSIDLHYCNVAEHYGEEIEAAGTNVCQFWTSASSLRRCNAAFHIDYISDRLRALLGLDEDLVADTIESQSLEGLYDISLLFPCVE